MANNTKKSNDYVIRNNDIREQYTSIVTTQGTDGNIKEEISQIPFIFGFRGVLSIRRRTKSE